LHDCTHIISGITEDGRKLRPSDWIDRICSSLNAFGQQHGVLTANTVQPCIIDGEKCLVVAHDLAEKNPSAYDFVMGFARTNHLRVISSCH